MENTSLNLTLTVEQVNVVLNALGELPFRMSSGLIEEIRNQAQPQLQAAASAPAEEAAAEGDDT